MINADITIVGGGIAGLISGALLSKAGKKVVVLERTGEFGGLFKMGRAFQTEHYFGAHHFAGINKNCIIGKVLEEVGISLSSDFEKVRHMDLLHEREVFHVPLELNELEKYLKENYPREDGIEPFFARIKEYHGYFCDGDEKGLLKMFLETSKMSYLELLQQYFSKEEVIYILTMLCPGYGAVGFHGVAFNNLSLLVSYGLGSGYAKESNSTIVQKIIDFAKENGCRFMAETECIGMNVEEGRFQGLRCKHKGEELELRSKVVLLAAYPFNILEEHLNDTRLWKKIERFETGASVIRICGRLSSAEGLSEGDTVYMGNHNMDTLDDHIFLEAHSKSPVYMMHIKTRGVHPAVMFTFLVNSDGKSRIPKAELMDIIERDFPEIVSRMPESLILYDRIYKEISNTESGAAFGWERTPYVYTHTNSFAPKLKEIEGVYGAGNWFTDYGIYGAVRTADKACKKILSDLGEPERSCKS
ncbi:MAG: phytoene desaturase family protein [Anaerovoracaceae bacterium]|jgi:phytoene dehydrogenase-like protein